MSHSRFSLCNADGSNPVNLTRTPDVEVLFPKSSPDRSKICFIADESKGRDDSHEHFPRALGLSPIENLFAWSIIFPWRIRSPSGNVKLY
jgi:hypothetical protein